MCVKSHLATVKICILSLICFLVASGKGSADLQKRVWKIMRTVTCYVSTSCVTRKCHKFGRNFCLLSYLLPPKLPRWFLGGWWVWCGGSGFPRHPMSNCDDHVLGLLVWDHIWQGQLLERPHTAGAGCWGSQGAGAREGGTSSPWGLTFGHLENQSNGESSKHNTKGLIEPRRSRGTYLNTC